jgi:colicin import membrane protein
MVDDSRRVIEPPAAKKLGKRAEALAQKKLEAAKKAEQAKKAAEEKTTLEKAEKEAAQKAAEEVKLAREKQAQAKKDAEEAAKLEREKQEQTKRAQKRAQEEAAAAKAMADKQAKLARAQQTAAATSGASAGKPGIKPEEFFISGNPDLAIAPPGATADDDGDGEGFGDGSEGGMSRDGVALINSIGRTWRPPRGLSPMLSARAEVTLAGNGSAEDIKIVEGSGVLAYDMAVRASLLRTEYPRAFWGKTIAVVFGKMPAR